MNDVQGRMNRLCFSSCTEGMQRRRASSLHLPLHLSTPPSIPLLVARSLPVSLPKLPSLHCTAYRTYSDSSMLYAPGKVCVCVYEREGERESVVCVCVTVK